MDWEMILSGVTAAAAIGGIYLTWKQINTSNKQALFDQRIKVMGYARNLFNIYGDNKADIIDEYLNNKSPDFTADFKFLLLTNAPELKDISKVIDKPINSSEHTNFLIELDNISRMGSNIKLLFNCKEAGYVSEFAIQYQLVLRELYRYQNILRKMEQLNKHSQKLLGDLQKEVGEPDGKKRLKQSLNKLDSAYEIVKDHDCFAKLENETRLG